MNQSKHVISTSLRGEIPFLLAKGAGFLGGPRNDTCIVTKNLRLPVFCWRLTVGGRVIAVDILGVEKDVVYVDGRGD